MDYGAMVCDAASYAKEAVFGKWTRWLLLIISTIIFPFMMGYMMEIFRGKSPAPELEKWGKLFIDGLKIFFATLIYMIPVIIVGILMFGITLIDFLSKLPAESRNNPQYLTLHPEIVMGVLPVIIVGLMVVIIIAVILSLIMTIGFIRMARTDRFREAFNFSAIFSTIGKIGWGGYILAMIIFWIISVIISLIFQLILQIPMIGWLIVLVANVLFILFEARYLTLIYQSAGVE
ncbi:MAG: DUF4013 domain-containing protein [Methanomicrobiales archaeon]|jgi:energy-converting hydrogenase Eha subunit A|nr:DUF4013 domain-containing protein [Methanomicrobiales archaeon]